MAIIGNTIKIHVEFVTWGGSKSDVLNGTIKIYDKFRKLLQTISLDDSTKVQTGVYEVKYVVPDGFGDLTAEASATLEGNPIVGRASIEREWA